VNLYQTLLIIILAELCRFHASIALILLIWGFLSSLLLVTQIKMKARGWCKGHRRQDC